MPPRCRLADANRECVVDRLRAIGSSDPDVLHAAKDELVRPFARQRAAGTGLCVVGVLVAATIRLAPLGAAVVVLGAWLWLKGRRNVATVEGGHAEFVETLAAKPRGPLSH